ncbi:MAG: DASH family cryptochrome [Halothiobacillaceae bacterium]
MNHGLYWFRNDLRLADNLALLQACASSDTLLPVYIHDSRQDTATAWGFPRRGEHRRAVLKSALQAVDAQLRARGSALLELEGTAWQLLPELVKQYQITTIYTEHIAAPEEQADVAALESRGIRVHALWQSSLIHPSALPFQVSQLPDMFAAFRKRVEQHAVKIEAPCAAAENLPPLPVAVSELENATLARDTAAPLPDARSAFPYFSEPCRVDEDGAQKHLAQYFARGLPHSYKSTRNGLIGIDYSSKWSPYLALGVLSARQILHGLRAFEAEHGASESSYWLWFELLWRDYFRFLHLKYGSRLYRAAGLSTAPKPTHHAQAFARWMNAETGHALIDAAMRELKATGYLSNRMRQVVASYLIHDLACDWRAGAAWFEAQLIDYDVYSNQGNWLYLAGRGTDPRGGRRFNPDKQANDYDADGRYRRLWVKDAFIKDE